MDSEAELILNTTLIGAAWIGAQLAMLVVDEDGHYIATNESACQLRGLATAS
jgi:hypothetical protein